MKWNFCPAAAILAAVLSVLLCGSFGYCQDTAENSIKIKGSVKNEIIISETDIAKLALTEKRVKVSGKTGEYLGSYVMKSVNLADLLDKAEVSKKADDGFDRELDMYIVVRGKDGRSALFSYGEIFLGREKGNVVVTAGARQIIPHKHPDLAPMGFDTKKWIDANDAAKVDLKSCVSCHNGKELSAVYIPSGFCLFSSSDASGARFIEGVTTIEVCQVSRKIEKEKLAKDKNEMWIEKPVLNIFDKNSSELAEGDLKNFAKDAHTSNTVGLGKGFHGTHNYEGKNFADFLKPACAKENADISRIYVLITAADGYRCLFSGGEIFDSVRGANLMLVETEDGKPLKKGDGKYKAFIKEDFFVDRAIRSVSEIYCGIIQ